MKKLLCFLFVLIITSCGNKTKSDPSSNSSASESEVNSTYYEEIALEGYNTGYKHGADDGYSFNYKSSYNPSCKYLFDEEKNNYESGYKNGYEAGFNAGKAEHMEKLESNKQILEESNTSEVIVSTQSTPNSYSTPNSSTEDNDFHNWKEDEISAFYVEIEDCESDEKAEYISNKYYLGEYIQEGSRYFARTSVNNGTYEAEVGEKVSNKLFKIKGTDIFMLFRWLPDASKWDEGILDVWNNKGSFYKKPN